MEFESIIKYLADHLEIRIDQVQTFGPKELIKIRLVLGGNVISEDYCELPDREND